MEISRITASPFTRCFPCALATALPSGLDILPRLVGQSVLQAIEHILCDSLFYTSDDGLCFRFGVVGCVYDGDLRPVNCQDYRVMVGRVWDVGPNVCS